MNANTIPAWLMIANANTNALERLFSSELAGRCRYCGGRLELLRDEQGREAYECQECAYEESAP